MSRSFALVLLAACGAPGGGDDGDDDDAPPRVDAAPSGNGSVFDAKYTSVSIEIDFENGEQPYTGPIVGFGDTFDLSQANLDRIFAGRKAVVLPRVIADMENVGPVADEELTSADILALAAAHRDLVDTATVKTYYMVFVSGYYADASGPLPGVLGVSIGNSGVIAMFKDVIESTNIPALPNVVRYVEQSTLIHEVGHAIGFVDNGVPMVVDHKDGVHGAHCTDDRCVMYYLNEGASEAVKFAQKYVLGNGTILWDAQCLADADALTGGPS
jgi:hypothetical protein